jgi:hypothetical protein
VFAGTRSPGTSARHRAKPAPGQMQSRATGGFYEDFSVKACPKPSNQTNGRATLKDIKYDIQNNDFDY